MNYIQKTPFMELYEELSTLNEAEVALLEPTDDLVSSEESTAIDIADTDLDGFLAERAAELKTAINAINTSIRYKDKAMILFTKTENGPTYYAPGKSTGWYKHKSVNPVDLASSWLGFLFIYNGLDAQATSTITPLIESLKARVGLNLDWSSLKIGRLCPQPGISRFPATLHNSYGIFVKYSELADDSVIMPFIQVIDSEKSVSSFKPKEEPTLATQDNAVDNEAEFDDFTRVKKFIEEFTKQYPSRILTENGRLTAIHVPTFVDYYLTLKQSLPKSVMETLLQTYFPGVTLGKNPDPNNPHKSVQYLYNAIKQEKVMAQNGFTRNTKATNAGTNVSDPYEWLVQRGSTSRFSDFYFKDIPIEAKQGIPATSNQIIVEGAHDAQYVVRFAYKLDPKEGAHTTSGKWHLYRFDKNEKVTQWNFRTKSYQTKTKALFNLVTKDQIKTTFEHEQELFDKTQDLNNNFSSLELVRL